MSTDLTRKAAFLDRDGVINFERGYVHQIEDFDFLPGSIEALGRLQGAGYALVVITNQSGIARGLYSEADYLEITAHMHRELLKSGVRLDAIEYCPHLPEAPLIRYRSDCDCRKPRPGMLTRAIAAIGIDAKRSILVGDRASDIEAGRAAGIGRCFLVRTGHPLSDRDLTLADGVYVDIAACVAELLG